MNGGRQRLRIIGGTWRGRKLSFPDLPGLRPTPDRVRETLFNWLRDIVPGARCLDLFAGSGALSFEALSRGAESAVLVDTHPAVITQLNQHLQTLQARGARVVQAEALTFLGGPAQAFDVVFLDPPFDSGLLAPCLNRLTEGAWLAPAAWLYVETARRASLPPLPEDWQVLRHKAAGQVGYYLLKRGAAAQGKPS